MIPLDSLDDNEWTRHGECDMCGFCCRVITTDVDLVFDTDDEEWMKVRGVDPMSKVKRLHIIDPCPKLGVNGQVCNIYPDRPQTCKDFPVDPAQVIGIPCTYWFESDKGEKVGGTRSPYPTEGIA